MTKSVSIRGRVVLRQRMRRARPVRQLASAATDIEFAIRAHQGHSVAAAITHEIIDPRKIALHYIIHGTQRRSLAGIACLGHLFPFDPDGVAMAREHVLFSPFGWKDFRSGRGAAVRDGANVLVVFDAYAIYDSGIQIERSRNGTILIRLPEGLPTKFDTDNIASEGSHIWNTD